MKKNDRITQKFALQPRGRSYLEVSWTGQWENLIVRQGKKELGSVQFLRDLKRGQEFYLEDKSTIKVQLMSGLKGNSELWLTWNGKRLFSSSQSACTMPLEVTGKSVPLTPQEQASPGWAQKSLKVFICLAIIFSLSQLSIEIVNSVLIAPSIFAALFNSITWILVIGVWIMVLLKIRQFRNWARRLYIVLGVLMLPCTFLMFYAMRYGVTSDVPIIALLRNINNSVDTGVSYVLLFLLLVPAVRTLFIVTRPRVLLRILLVIVFIINIGTGIFVCSAASFCQQMIAPTPQGDIVLTDMGEAWVSNMPLEWQLYFRNFIDTVNTSLRQFAPPGLVDEDVQVYSTDL
ncbi:hypothetical protein HY626_04090 [Candidatus Uhrbacteria bacterium]|nr:hypothetical protein [Candidatus Uhrbacteria bacterium]